MPSPDGALIDEVRARRLLVGPDSVCWRYCSDVRLDFAILYPLLLQVAHPTVGAGVRDFSQFEQHPYERLLRTVDYVTLLVYGRDDAIAAARRLRELHHRFRGVRDDGRRYSALEPRAYAWVHATLLQTYVAGHAHFGRPLSPTQVERFYAEYRGLGRLIGVGPRDLPSTWTGFCAYFARVIEEELELNDSVRRVLRAVGLAGPRFLPLPGPLWSLSRIPVGRAIWLGGVGLLAPGLRRRLQIPWGMADELSFQALGRLSRAMTPVMPERLQCAGPNQLRARRSAIAAGPLGTARTGSARWPYPDPERASTVAAC